ncbi:uncharacterized protein FFFS_15993 [Fusarium fujikuroi]|nr:uncharacterized protein FFFS_15993 [Fusarium fujikuroi]
MPLSFL